MSWKMSVFLWSLGPFDLHGFHHALDDQHRLFVILGWRRRQWQVWPYRPSWQSFSHA